MRANKHETEADLWHYNSQDCVVTRECGEAELSAIQAFNLQAVEEFQQKLFWPVLKAMNQGVRIDLQERARFGRELTGEIEKRKAWLTRVCGHPLNPASPKQMQAFFYGDLRLPTVWKKTPNGNVPTLDEGALDILKRKEPLIKDIIRTIQELRSLNVFRSTFVEMELDADNRMRCSYNICGTKTYRFAAKANAFGTGGNLQTIPKGGEDDDSDLILPNVRTLFVPDQGYEWFDADLSKADLRTVVWESDCKEMKEMLREGRDPYIETAREFHKDYTITKYKPDGTVNKKYDDFKRFGHGTHFLGTPQGLAQRIGLTVHEATRTQAWYFGKYPAIKKWQENFIEEVKRTHSVSNKFGYRFNFMGRIDDKTFRDAIAWVPQSTTGCVINRIWMNLHETAPEVAVLLQVHDSLDGQFLIKDREVALAHLKRCGEVVIPYDEPLIIPFEVKTSTKSWGHC